MLATIQEMSGGRFKLGLGTGWLEAEHTQFGIDFPDKRSDSLRLEEALGYLRAAFANPPVDFSGDYYDFAAFDMLPRPELKLVVGGKGAVKTPRLAGTYADELNAYPAVSDEYRAKIERARNAPRSPQPVTLRVPADFELRPDNRRRHGGRVPRAYWRRSQPSTAPPQIRLEEEAAKRNAPRGTWQQVRDILAGMEELGMSRFYFQGTFDPDAHRTDDSRNSHRKAGDGSIARSRIHSRSSGWYRVWLPRLAVATVTVLAAIVRQHLGLREHIRVHRHPGHLGVCRFCHAPRGGSAQQSGLASGPRHRRWSCLRQRPSSPSSPTP